MLRNIDRLSGLVEPSLRQASCRTGNLNGNFLERQNGHEGKSDALQGEMLTERSSSASTQGVFANPKRPEESRS